MDINKLTNIIRESLKNKLPGIEAQNMFAPQFRFGKDYNPSPNAAKKSAVLILLYPDNGKVKIPVIQKTVYNGIHSGQISLPGGQYENEDVTLDNTAKRETEEEIGVNRDEVEILGKLTDLFIPVSNFIVKPYVGILNRKPAFRLNPNEVADIFSLNINEFINPKIEQKEVTVRDSTIKAPFFIFENTEIWGATAMILNEFSEIVKKFNVEKILINE